MTALSPLDPRTRVVTAAAGSGKTSLLVRRYLRHLHTTTPDRIVAITFTRKAAAELVERIRQGLQARIDPEAASPKVRALLLPHAPDAETARRALELLPTAPVCTVDAFVLSLLDEFLLHARLPLGDGTTAWLDGPLEPGGSPGGAYRAAARDLLEELDADARTLLREQPFGACITDLATLAREGVDPEPAAGALITQVGLALLQEGGAVRYAERCPSGVAGVVHEPVAQWLRSPSDRAPLALLRWLATTDDEALCAVRRRVMTAATGALGLPDPGDSIWWRGDHGWKGMDWVEDALVDRSDAVVGALGRLVRRTRRIALGELARTGELGYDELLWAATELCADPPQALAERFDVLMVDELQDTNPSQLRFYRAFAGMQRVERPPITGFFVGDARQSIYRFRAADPFGWRTFVDEAKADGAWAPQQVNYRSSRRLVALQRALFGALEASGERGVDRLDDLAPAAEAEEGALTDAVWEEPVVIVDRPGATSVDADGLAAFAARLRARWARFPTETAAVLVPTWATGEGAVRVLAAHGVAAQLEGDRSLLGTRTATDLRLWLRGLLDPTDDIAMAGILKHPSIGLTDRGLLLLRRGGGLTSVFAPDAPLDALDEADRDVLLPLLPVLREGRRRIGRESTADVLEWLAAVLRWRALIAAGPESGGGRAQAELDVLLEVVRTVEAQRVDPAAVLEQLTPRDDADPQDLPVIRLERSDEVVAVTTYYGAKGLEFDHVALLGVDGSRGANGLTRGGCYVAGRPEGLHLTGAKLDVDGGLHPTTGPVARLASTLGRTEAREESLRLFYVGLTRARRSATFALGKDLNVGPRRQLRSLRAALVRETLVPGAVRVIGGDELGAPVATGTTRAPTRRRRPFAATWQAGEGLDLISPSHRKASGLAAELRKRARVEVGRPAPPMPKVPGFDRVDERAWGDAIHGWLELWGFRGEPALADAQAYLAESWSTNEPAIARWFVDLGLGLRDGLPGFKALLDEATALHFEWPLMGSWDARELVAGRADLVVELPGRKVVVIDFKAGPRYATSTTDIPGLSGYAGQLDAYARLLEAAGYAVRETALVYVRGPSWARFG